MKNLIRIFAFLVLIFLVNVSFADVGQDRPGNHWIFGTWTITNETAEETYSDSSGQVTFYRNEFTIDAGRFAAAGLVHSSENTHCLKPLNPIFFKFLGRARIYIWWNAETPSGGIAHEDAMLTIIKRRGRRLTLIGQGGCGSGRIRISYLEKIY